MKIYKIQNTKSRHGRESSTYMSDIGTVAELVAYYRYTLETGQSWQHEKGNRKINCNPKGIKSLITNLNNAKNNSAANGYSGTRYEEVTVTQAEKDEYFGK